MTDDTINDAVTMQPGSEGTLLVNRYRIVRQLGQGGMGSVWLVEDTQLDNKQFAVKMLPSILVANKRAYRQLKDEALVAMRLVHPNIVQIRAFEENNGNPFLVMDYVDGQILDDYLAENGRLTEEEVIRVLRPVAAALDYAHGKGVVHRDVKPGNVMIAKDGTPYILDFGIAREIQETMTRVTGQLSSGTLLYMSPEQLRGQPSKPAQDIYSFAAMAYECLKGEPPFSRGQIEYQILNEQPEPLVGYDASIAPLVAGVMAGLAKENGARPVTCSAVLDGGTIRGEAEARGMAGVRIPPIGHGNALKMVAFAALLALVAVGGWWYVNIRSTGTTGGAPVAIPSTIVTNEIVRVITNEVLKPPRQAQTNDTTLADARHKAEAERKRVAELVRFKTRIQIKLSDARDKMVRVGDFRSDPDGLEVHIASADSQWKTLAALGTPTTLEEAQAAFDTVDKAEAQIAMDLKWLEENRSGRDAVKAASAEIADLVKGDTVTFKAAENAAVTYGEGVRLRNEGDAAFKIGEFAEAGRKMGEAKRKFAEAAREAKAFVVKATLESAKGFLDAEKWRDCISEVEKVLIWDAANEEATRLKTEAGKHLVPFLRVVATIDGREVAGAVLNDGQKDFSTPIDWRLETGSRYGPYKVSYEKNGSRYFGTFDAVTVDWCGPKVVAVALEECKEPKVGGTMTITLPGGGKMEMIYVAPGSFMMGSPPSEAGHVDDETQHRVLLTKGYWLGKYEVTQEQWESVMGSNPSSWKGGDLPVSSVSWQDCQEFIRKVNKRQNCGARLPTEAEWEYACRAGTTDMYAGFLGSMAWYAENCDNETHAVGKKKPNMWGFYDMHGNVSEWCSDWYGDYASGLTRDPIGPVSGGSRVLRGGSLYDFAGSCRSAGRSWDAPDCRLRSYGFRLCCSVGSDSNSQ